MSTCMSYSRDCSWDCSVFASGLWGKVIRWLLTIDAETRPTAGELLSSALLPPKLEVEAAFLRYCTVLYRLRFVLELVWYSNI